MMRMVGGALTGWIGAASLLIGCGSDSGNSGGAVSCAADGVCQSACAADPDCAAASGGGSGTGGSGTGGSGTGGSGAGGSGGGATTGGAPGTGGSGPNAPPADPACAQYADASSPLPADLKAVLDPLPLVACAVDTCQGTPATLSLPASANGQYLIVTYVRGGNAFGFAMSPTQDLSNDRALTWSENWPATLPAPTNGITGLLLNSCDSVGAQEPMQIFADGCMQATDGVALAYYYRPLNAEQCTAGSLAGVDCVWDHNCSTELVCTGFRCTSG